MDMVIQIASIYVREVREEYYITWCKSVTACDWLRYDPWEVENRTTDTRSFPGPGSAQTYKPQIADRITNIPLENRGDHRRVYNQNIFQHQVQLFPYPSTNKMQNHSCSNHRTSTNNYMLQRRRLMEVMYACLNLSIDNLSKIMYPNRSQYIFIRACFSYCVCHWSRMVVF